MNKLDDIPKKTPFEVPDEYFDRLPGRIQARIQTRQEGRIPAFGQFRYAAAVFVLAMLAFAWLWSDSGETSRATSPEAILASLDTDELVAYLADSEYTTDELLDDLRLSDELATQIETAVLDMDINESSSDDLTNDIE